jgi:hypothetical protein
LKVSRQTESVSMAFEWSFYTNPKIRCEILILAVESVKQAFLENKLDELKMEKLVF